MNKNILGGGLNDLNLKSQEDTSKIKDLNKVLKYYIDKVNILLEDSLDENGNVRMRDFKRSVDGGLYSKEEIKGDEKKTKSLTREWAMYYWDLDDSDNEGLINKKVTEYKDQKINGRGSELEKLLMININRIIGPEYIVARSSEYDDYVNGVDFLVIEADTGIVACGFDGVYDKEGGDRYQKKMEKIRKKAKKGGAKIKYGLTYNNGKMEQTQVDNIPTFCLNLNEEEFLNLKKAMNYDLSDDSGPSSVELEVFDKLMISLDKQIQKMKSFDVDQRVRANVDRFSESLSKARKLKKERFNS